jgi:hypothetical protein
MAYESQFVMLSANYEADLKEAIESLKKGISKYTCLQMNVHENIHIYINIYIYICM